MPEKSPNILRLLYGDLDDNDGRFDYLSWLLRTLPGKAGGRIRGAVLGRYFASFGKNVEYFPGVKIRGVHNLSIGDNVGLGEDLFIQANGGVEIGNNVAIGPGVKIWSVNHKFGKTGPVNDYELKKVVIEDDVWIAANCFIMPGVTIPRGTIISACSVVGVKAYPPYRIIAGHPARVISCRQGEGEDEP